MSRSVFQVTCRHCRAAFSTPFPQETARLRCPECAREAPGREFEYAPVSQAVGSLSVDPGKSPFESAPQGGFERRGKWILFKCPHCQWAMRIREDLSSTSLVDCGRCGLEILPPDPEAGTPATLTRAGALRLGRTTSGPVTEGRGPGGPGVPSVAGRVTGEDRGALKALQTDQTNRAFREHVAPSRETGLSWDAGPRSAVSEEGLLRQAKVVRHVMIGLLVIFVGLAFLIQRKQPKSEVSANAGLEALPAQETGTVLSDPLVEKAKALAAELAASDDWRKLTPHVRHAKRVAPLMADFYSRHAFAPQRLVSFDRPIVLEVGGLRYLQFGAVAEGGDRRVVGFEETKDGGLAFDWEVYEDVAADQWDVFRAERPSSGRTLRFAFIRASVDDRYFADAGLTRESGIAVRIWLRRREDALVAVFPKDSLAGAMIEKVGSWDVGKLVIGDLSFPVGSSLPDRVEFEHLAQDRWLITADRKDPVF